MVSPAILILSESGPAVRPRVTSSRVRGVENPSLRQSRGTISLSIRFSLNFPRVTAGHRGITPRTISLSRPLLF